MRVERALSRVLLAGLGLAGLSQAHAAQVDPNDPKQARDRYVAPKAEAPRLDVPGLREATPRERSGLGLLSVIDQYQADLSRLALDRGVDPAVQAWAEKTLQTHAARKGQHDAWLPDIGQPRAQAWIRRGQQELDALRKADSRAVSAAYLQAMTQSLAETLALLEDELIPQASTPEVRGHLASLRAPLDAELAQARRLQAGDDAPQGA